MMTPKNLKKVSLALILVLSSLPAAASRLATPPFREIEIRTDFGFAKEPLTTETIGELDPRQKNPHLQRWILNRQIELIGLTGFHRADGKWGVRLKGIDSINKGYLRRPGNAYSNLRDFSCGAKPDEWFHTVEGAKQALVQANALWIKLLKENEVKLGWLLSHIATDSVDLALKRGQQSFDVWFEEADLKWREAFDNEVRTVEWKFYQTQAEAQGICQGDKRVLPGEAAFSGLKPPMNRLFMEPVSDEPPPSIIKILARAPARLWNGLFSVRIEVGINGKKLNGRFLIDSSANVSLISPAWLESQGIYPEWVQIPNVAPKRVVWSRLGKDGPGLTKRVQVSSVMMSGFQIPIREFGLADTEIFSPPESLGSCCDGMIGNDFLSQYPVEFQSESPAEVRVWPKRDFHRSPETPWIQVSSGDNGELVSQCEVSSPTGSIQLKGARWDNGSQEALILHSPWQKEIGSKINDFWSIFCDGQISIAQGIPMVSAEARSSFSVRYPAVNLGGPILNRGSYTIDLPHGRLWLTQESLKKTLKKPSPTGLQLGYVFKNGERVLQVQAIRPDFSTQLLIQSGLKKGMIVTRVDHRLAEEMDQWEVNRHLSGEYGDTVSVEWKLRDQFKMAPLRHPTRF